MAKKYLKLEPHMLTKIWGGERLSKLKNKQKEAWGESWELSFLKDSPSLVEGKPISEVIATKDFPYLIKLIDTSDNLSVQTHPTKNYAAKHNIVSKEECWVILDHAPGAGLYLGFNQNTTKESFRRSITEGKVEENLNFYPVKKGDFFFIPAGTIHAIGKDIFLAEVQQSADCTFRVYDWNRKDDKGESRELHIEESLEVLDFKKQRKTDFSFQENIFERDYIFEHKDFCLKSLSFNQETQISLNNPRGATLLCFTDCDGDVKGKAFESFFFPTYDEILNIKIHNGESRFEGLLVY